MTLPSSDGFSEAVTEGHIYARSIFVCDSSFEIVDEVPVGEGTSIDVGAGLVRRSGNIVIPNPAGLYTPVRDGIVDAGKPFLVRFTVQTPDGDLSCDQPMLFPDTDEAELFGDVTVPVSDGGRIFSGDATLSLPVSYEDGSPLERLVRGLLVAAGAPDDDAYYDLESEGENIVGDHGYEIGIRPGDALETLLKDHACDLWVAPPLVYTLRPIPDPLTSEPAVTWIVGSQVKIHALSVKRQYLAKNHAIVEGLDRQGKPFTVEAFDLNPESPVMYGTPGVGDLVARRKSDGIRDYDQALRVARMLLTRYSVTRTFSVTVPVDPSRDRRDVVRLIDPNSGMDTQGMIDSFTLPAAPGTQQFLVSDGRSLE